MYILETVPIAIPLSLALQKHTQKENERTLIATELSQPSSAIGNGTSAHSHKKRQPPLTKTPAPSKGRTRTSARQANGRSTAASTAASTSASAPVSVASSPRPKRAAAQKSRGNWAQADEDVPDYEEEVSNYPPPEGGPMDVDNEVVQFKVPSKQGFGSVGQGRGGIMKGFGPGAYSKVGGVTLGGSTRSASASPGLSGPGTSPQHSRGPWGFPPEPPRYVINVWRVIIADFGTSNTGRTIYSDRTDEEARKAAVEAEEQLRYKRARQKLEEELLVQDEPNGQTQAQPQEWTSEA